MNKLKLLSLSIFSSLILLGCGSSGAPSCSDDDVLDVVKQVIHEKILDDYTKYQTDAPNYKLLKQAAESKPDSAWGKQIKIVEEKASEATINFSGMRSQGQNDELRKIECQCQVSIERENALTKKQGTTDATLTYTAQYSEDDQVYVEVFGL